MVLKEGECKVERECNTIIIIILVSDIYDMQHMKKGIY